MASGKITLKGAKTVKEEYVLERTRDLALEWGVEGDGTVRITNRRNSVAYGKHPDYGWLITYGRADVLDTWKWGMYEYKTVECMLTERNLPAQVGAYVNLEGNPELQKCALDVLVAHEFAHVLVRRMYDCTYRHGRGGWTIKPHGPEWREVYANLLDELVDKWDPTYLWDCYNRLQVN